MMKFSVLTFVPLVLFSQISWGNSGSVSCSQGPGGGRMEYSLSISEPKIYQGHPQLQVAHGIEEKDVRVRQGGVLKSRIEFKGFINLDSFDILVANPKFSPSDRIYGRLQGRRDAKRVWRFFYQPWTLLKDEKGYYYSPDPELKPAQLYCWNN